MNVVSLDSYRCQRCDCNATCTRTVTHWDDDEDDNYLDLEDDEPWWHYRPSLALVACWLLALASFTPTMRLVVWLVYWGACILNHLFGDGTIDPPPAYTPWAPHLYP